MLLSLAIVLSCTHLRFLLPRLITVLVQRRFAVCRAPAGTRYCLGHWCALVCLRWAEFPLEKQNSEAAALIIVAMLTPWRPTVVLGPPGLQVLT
jgi:hypothetical protein